MTCVCLSELIAPCVCLLCAYSMFASYAVCKNTLRLRCAVVSMLFVVTSSDHINYIGRTETKKGDEKKTDYVLVSISQIEQEDAAHGNSYFRSITRTTEVGMWGHVMSCFHTAC